jgi:hypothetical protein
MALVMLSAGMFSPRARSDGLAQPGVAALTSPPPMRAATVTSLISLVQTLARLASAAPFLCLMVDQRECPLMSVVSQRRVGDPG